MSPNQLQEHLMGVSYGQFHLAPMSIPPVFDGDVVGPLVLVTNQDTAIIVTTGCSDGDVKISIQMWSKPPPDPDTTWEVSGEVDLFMDGPLYLSSPTVAAGPFEPVLTPSTPGRHRVRISGRGRNVEPRVVATSINESYLVQAWASSFATEQRLLRDDGFPR